MPKCNHRESARNKTQACRNCSKPIELIMGGCTISEDEHGIHTCLGYSEFDLTNDVNLEYDGLCAECYHNTNIPRGKSLCEVLFEGAEAGEKIELYLDEHPIVASWKKI